VLLPLSTIYRLTSLSVSLFGAMMNMNEAIAPGTRLNQAQASAMFLRAMSRYKYNVASRARPLTPPPRVSRLPAARAPVLNRLIVAIVANKMTNSLMALPTSDRA
jgi:hypothetical protein